jgi:hypothetical protein
MGRDRLHAGDGKSDQIMTESDQADSSHKRLDSLEQRLTALEAENAELKATLEQHQSTTPLDITRRQALASLLGGGAFLSATGTAASKSPGHAASSGGSPWNDNDGDSLLEPDAEFDGIDTHKVKTRPTETHPNIGIVPRELISQEDTTIHVDPSGNDNNDGSEGSPVATIQEAVNRLPLFILHSITIDIADGRYTSDKESPAVHVGPIILKGEGDINLSDMMQQHASAATRRDGITKGHTFTSDLKSAPVGGDAGEGTVTVAGNESDPSSVYVDVGINWTVFGKLEHMRVNGIHWDSLSQFAGQANARNCVFRGNGTAAISGKNGHVYFKNCDIGNGNTDQYAIWGIQLERMYFDFCTFNATDAALNVYNGDVYQLSGRNTVNAPETFTMSGGAIATQGTDLYVGGERK